MTWLALLLAILLAVIHLVAGKLRFLDVIPRSRWLSFAGGTSVAYVFGHLLPRLAEGQHALEAALPPLLIPRGMLVWSTALTGLVAFYGLERRAREASRRTGDGRTPGDTERRVFRLHVASYAFYNLLIGYLLMGKLEHHVTALLIFWVAMAMHFVVNDYGLRKDHQERYTGAGRWILAAAVIAGSALGLMVDVPEWAIVLITALIGGGVIMNVLKEELPEHRQSRFGAFAAGAGGYLVLLLAI